MTGVRDYETGELKHNVVALAKAAKVLRIPTVVTTTARDSMWGPTFPELVEVVGGEHIIDRSSVNALMCDETSDGCVGSEYSALALHRPRLRDTVPAVTIRGLCHWGLLVVFLVAAAGCSSVITTGAGRDGPAQTAYPPPGGKGPIVLLLSGHSGPDHYQPIAAAVARLGYYAVLLDGKDILTREQDGRGNLRQAIARAQASPYALSGKTAVIGFSQGGGAALVHAADMPEVVSAVVAYYPQTNFVADASLSSRGGSKCRC